MCTEQEYFYLELSLGLYNNESFTLEEVGNIMKITRERVRQIEHRTLRKLRYKMEVNKDMIGIVKNI